MKTCYLGLGSNLADRIGMISRALCCLTGSGALVLRRVSRFYLSEPWGYRDQPDFINAVVEIETHLEPLELLEVAKNTEVIVGRRRRHRWGPREVDIDILLYGNEIVKIDGLEIPHPRMCERGFVLAPLVEINSQLEHPATGRKFTSHLAELEAKGERKWQNLII